MKQFVIIAFLALSFQCALAQNNGHIFKPFKVDVSVGYAVPQGSGTKGGVLFVVEPKYAIMDQLALGLRMEAALTARGYVVDGQDFSGAVAASASYLATGDYYFTNEKFRPFVGAGLGIFSLASVKVDANTDPNATDIPTDSKFGFMIRGGFEVGHFRMGAEYNFVGKSDNGIKNGYLGIKLGVCIGGGRY